MHLILTTFIAMERYFKIDANSPNGQVLLAMLQKMRELDPDSVAEITEAVTHGNIEELAKLIAGDEAADGKPIDLHKRLSHLTNIIPPMGKDVNKIK